MIKIVCISDTHNYHNSVVMPEGDILIHAGDATGIGNEAQLRDFGKWIGDLDYAHKIIIPGNHDFGYQKNMNQAKTWVKGGDSRIQILHNRFTTVSVEGRDVSFYGSGSTPRFHDWAFNLDDADLQLEWSKIVKCDILVTHGPPRGILDLCASGHRAGCLHLLNKIKELAPKFHVFGHIHEGYGVVQQEGTTFVNASTCTKSYKPTNPPIVIEF